MERRAEAMANDFELDDILAEFSRAAEPHKTDVPSAAAPKAAVQQRMAANAAPQPAPSVRRSTAQKTADSPAQPRRRPQPSNSEAPVRSVSSSRRSTPAPAAERPVPAETRPAPRRPSGKAKRRRVRRLICLILAVLIVIAAAITVYWVTSQPSQEDGTVSSVRLSDSIENAAAQLGAAAEALLQTAPSAEN